MHWGLGILTKPPTRVRGYCVGAQSNFIVHSANVYPAMPLLQPQHRNATVFVSYGGCTPECLLSNQTVLLNTNFQDEV